MMSPGGVSSLAVVTSADDIRLGDVEVSDSDR